MLTVDASLKKTEVAPRRMLSDVVHEKLWAGHYSYRTEEGISGLDSAVYPVPRGPPPAGIARALGVVAILENLAGPGKIWRPPKIRH